MKSSLRLRWGKDQTSIRKWAKDMDWQFTKIKDIKMALKHLQRCLTSLRKEGCKLTLHCDTTSHLSSDWQNWHVMTHSLRLMGRKQEILTSCCRKTQWCNLCGGTFSQNNIYKYLEIYPEGTHLAIQKHIYTRSVIVVVVFVIVNYWKPECLSGWVNHGKFTRWDTM